MSRAVTLRKSFVSYFERHGHRFYPSSKVLPPPSDRSLLFSNAGMNQFKERLLGNVNAFPPGIDRVTNYQKCIRLSGRHNDIDDVGMDGYHHTFFEMLGSWSFGSYGRRRACELALDFLCSELKLPLSSMYFTYFAGGSAVPPDKETQQIWVDLGVPPNRIIPCAGLRGHNFWEASRYGGPCGPSTEIHFDRLHRKTDQSGLVNKDDENLLEIWNIVFIELNRDSVLRPLGVLNIDTGMGLERLLSIIEEVPSNYHSSLFSNIFNKISQDSNSKTFEDLSNINSKDAYLLKSYRILADHIRCLTVALNDGAIFGPGGRGTVLRRLLKRAIFASESAFRLPHDYLCNLVDAVASELRQSYPELNSDLAHVKTALKDEADRAKKVLDYGRNLLEKKCANTSSISADFMWRLHSSVGLPLEITSTLLDSRGISYDEERLEQCKREENTPSVHFKSRSNKALSAGEVEDIRCSDIAPTDCSLVHKISEIENNFEVKLLATFLFQPNDDDEEEVNRKTFKFIFDRTPFYSIAGGQQCDNGIVRCDTGTLVISHVSSISGYVSHYGHVESGELPEIGSSMIASVNLVRRDALMRSHSATHLLLKALQIYNHEVQQLGSSCTIDDLRLDVNSKKLSLENIQAIEKVVNEMIAENVKRERYVDEVGEAVISFDFKSFKCEEFCCGTHVKQSGDIAHFSIVENRTLKSGVIRIGAFTGPRALANHQRFSELHKDYKNVINMADNLAKFPYLNSLTRDKLRNASTLPLLDKIRLRNEANSILDTIRKEKRVLQQDLIDNIVEDLELNCNNSSFYVRVFQGREALILSIDFISSILLKRSCHLPFLFILEREDIDRSIFLFSFPDKDFLENIKKTEDILGASFELNKSVTRWPHIAGTVPFNSPSLQSLPKLFVQNL